MGSTDISSSITWRSSSSPSSYEEARIGRVFNHRRPSRYPTGVLSATCAQDIVAGVKLAIAQNLRVSVRSGGHSWAAWSVRDDALLIDLGEYKLIELDEKTNVVRASPSTTGAMLNGYLGERGKMFGGGHCPDVGIGGFLLQGGMGWNSKNWGWACENIVAIEVVTAEGEELLCNAEQNSDLLWAARGAGPGFPAIVTAFHLSVRDAFPSMMSSTFMYPMSRYKEILDWTIATAPTCDPSLEVVAVGLRPDPSDSPLIMASFLSFSRDPTSALASLAPINAAYPPDPVQSFINQPTSIANECIGQRTANPKGHRYMSDNAYVRNDADVTEVLRDAFTTLPEGTGTFALWYAMNPASRRPLIDMAMSVQSDHYFALYTVWKESVDDERCIEWVKGIMRGVEKDEVGAYLGDSDFQVRQTRFWSDKNAEKLMALRRKWDPHGRICGYLDVGDKSGTKGLANVQEWAAA